MTRPDGCANLSGGCSSPDTGARTRGDVLITGATGFLGIELMAGLLEDGDRRVWALVRSLPEPAPT